MRNRAIAMALTLCMVVGMFFVMPTPAYAKTDDSVNGAVEFLTALGIMETDEYTGEFWDDSLVKRFEMAQILCRLMGYDVKAGAERKFTDVGDVDRPYVETVVRNGLMNGYGDGRFGSNDYVTCEQVFKIFVDMLGGKDLANALGGFPYGYISAAKRLGIGNRMTVGTDEVARRVDVAKVIYDSLHVDMIKLEGYGKDGANYTIIDGKSMLTEILDIEIIEGTLTAIDSTSINRASGGCGDDRIIVDDKTIIDENHSGDKFLGSEVRAYVKVSDKNDTKTLIYIEEGPYNEITSLRGDDISSVSDEQLKYYVGDKTRVLKFSAITDMVYNGKAVAFDKSRFKDNSSVLIEATDRDGDGVVDFVNIEEYKDYVVERVDTENETIYFKYGEQAVKLENTYSRVFLDGVAENISQLAEGTVVSIAVSEGTTDKFIKIEGCTDTAMGQVERTYKKDGRLYAVIEGKDLLVSETAERLWKANLITEIKAGVSGTMYQNKVGEIVYASTSGSSGSIGYLVNTSKNNTGFDYELSFKVYNDKGEMAIYNAKDKIIVNGTKMNVNDFAKSTQWTVIENEVRGKQLIKYTEQDGVITKIDYCSNTPRYDKNEFSLDVQESLYVRKQYTLGYTYTADATTKVFCVPSDGSDKVSDYRILTGTYFKRDKTYDVSLYDLTPQGKISYAIVRSSGSVLTVDNAFLFVTSVSKGINSDGEEVNIIEGYNTSGADTRIQSMPGEELTDYSDLTIKVEKGDLIQYALNAVNSIEEIKVVQKMSNTTHNGIGNVHNNDRQTSFGYAANVSSSGFLVSETKHTDEIDPTDTKAYIPAGGAVIICDRDRGVITKSMYTDLVSGDEVYALCNASNSTMFIIIYR